MRKTEEEAISARRSLLPASVLKVSFPSASFSEYAYFQTLVRESALASSKGTTPSIKSFLSIAAVEPEMDAYSMPIQLHHLNLKHKHGEKLNYHKQPRLFLSYQDVFDYILRHDNELIDLVDKKKIFGIDS